MATYLFPLHCSSTMECVEAIQMLMGGQLSTEICVYANNRTSLPLRGHLPAATTWTNHRRQSYMTQATGGWILHDRRQGWEKRFIERHQSKDIKCQSWNRNEIYFTVLYLSLTKLYSIICVYQKYGYYKTNWVMKSIDVIRRGLVELRQFHTWD